MSGDYTSKPASEVKAGDIIYWASVRADVEVVSAGPLGFYGYTFDVRYKGEIEQARYRNDEKVQVKRVVEDKVAEQFESIYGPMPKFSEFKRGERIRYRSGAGTSTGEIVWVCSPQIVAGRQEPTQYIIANDAHDGFPDVVLQSDIIQ